MSAAELESCLARLYVDPTYRRLLAVYPEALRADYVLTAPEAAIVRSIDPRRLEAFAGALRQKRREAIADSYPSLFALELPAMERYCDRYFQLYLPKPEAGRGDDALNFGGFIEQTLSTDAEVARWVVELARYERLIHAAIRCSAAVLDGAAPRVTVDTRLRLHPSAILDQFDYDVYAIAESLAAARTPAPESKRCAMVFQRRAGESVPVTFAVSSQAGDLLARCDGRLRVGELIRGLRSDDASVEGSTLEFLTHLLALRVLEVAR